MEPHIPASVAKDQVLTFNLCLHQWHRNNQLAGCLKHPERPAEALRTLEESQRADLDNEALSQWCSAWFLSYLPPVHQSLVDLPAGRRDVKKLSFNNFDISISAARFPFPEEDRPLVLLREAGSDLNGNRFQ